MHGLLYDLGIAVIVSTIVGYIFHRIKQPTIVAYLVAGAMIGPEMGPTPISNLENIEIISEIGLILLLFIIGLEMHPSHVMTMVKRVYMPGIGQFWLTVVAGTGLFVWMGYSLTTDNLEALYLGLAISLSSTAIVIKLLHDAAQLDTFGGRLAIGILLFQDLWAIMVLAVQPELKAAHAGPILLAIGKTILLISVTFLVSRFILPRIFNSIQRSPEMVVTVSIGWCTMVVALAKVLSLSMEMGALVAGVAISTFPYNHFVTAKVSPLRDFFLTLFFVALGMKIPFPEWSIIEPALALAGLAVLFRFMTVVPLGMAGKSSLRTSFIAALNLSQISEFSLVIVSIGVGLGHIGQNVMSIVLYAMTISAIASSYFIKYNFPIYKGFEAMLYKLGLAKGERRVESEDSPDEEPADIIVLGYHRGSESLLDFIALRNHDIFNRMKIVDFNAETISSVEAMGVRHSLGDFSKIDVLEEAGVPSAKIVISTIPDLLLRGTNNTKLVEMCRSLNPEAYIIATCDMARSIEPMKNAGANEVILPYFSAAAQISEIVVSVDERLRPSVEASAD